MKLTTARKAIYACIAAVVLFAIPMVIVRKPVWFILVILALAAELIISFMYLRCPHCGRHLDRTGMRSDITHCPFCGREL